jgi:hypothetical protein
VISCDSSTPHGNNSTNNLNNLPDADVDGEDLFDADAYADGDADAEGPLPRPVTTHLG